MDDIPAPDILGMFRRHKCACGGERLGWWRSMLDLWERVTRRSPWMYKVSVTGSPKTSNRTFTLSRRWEQDEHHPPPKWRIEEHGAPTERTISEYSVYRTAAIDGVSYIGHQCALCSAWSRENTGDDRQTRSKEKIAYDYRRTFRSARSADEYARRLQYGVPQNWEFVTALMAALGGAAIAGLIELLRTVI